MAPLSYGLYTFMGEVWTTIHYIDVVACEIAFDRAKKDRFIKRVAIIRCDDYHDPLEVLVNWIRPY